MSLIEKLTDDEIKAVVGDKEKSRMLADALKMELLLKLKKAIEEENTKQIILHAWEIFEAEIVSCSGGDEQRIVGLVANLLANTLANVKGFKDKIKEMGLTNLLKG